MSITKLLLICIVLGFRFVFGLYGGRHKGRVYHEKRSLVFVWGVDVNCSGTLINPDWVISSAHCFFYRMASEKFKHFAIYSVTHIDRGFTQEKDVARTGRQIRIVREIYQEVISVPGGRGREAVLLQLKITSVTRWGRFGTIQDLASIRMVRGPFPPIDLDGLHCYESGYGFDGRPMSSTPMFKRIFVKHPRICLQMQTSPLYKELCVQEPRGEGNCFGDWGSPITCETKDQPDGVLVGVSMRSVHRDGSLARPYHCARGDVVQVYAYAGAIYRWARYYIKELRDPKYLWVLTGDAQEK